MAGCLTLFLHGLLILALAGFCGCASTPSEQKSATVVKSVEDPETQILRDGVEAFKKSDYNRASALFEAVIEQTRNDVILRRALYSLACCKLAQAQGCSDVYQAIVIWNRWEKLRPRDYDGEDPLMLSPFLTQLNAWKTTSTPVYVEHFPASNKLEMCRDSLDKRQKEILQLKSKLESSQRETADLRTRIKKLKEQINSLEAIHREIQQKKKEVSSQ